MLADIAILEDRSRFIAVMQGGEIKAGRLGRPLIAWPFVNDCQSLARAGAQKSADPKKVVTVVRALCALDLRSDDPVFARFSASFSDATHCCGASCEVVLLATVCQASYRPVRRAQGLAFLAVTPSLARSLKARSTRLGFDELAVCAGGLWLYVTLTEPGWVTLLIETIGVLAVWLLLVVTAGTVPIDFPEDDVLPTTTWDGLHRVQAERRRRPQSCRTPNC